MLQDPFYVVKDEVQQAVTGVSNLFKRWQDLLRKTNTATDEEYIWVTNEVKSGVRSIEWDLQDLEETISIAEANPQKFNFSAEELASRKKFISQTKATIGEIKQAMVGTVAQNKQESDQRSVLMKSNKNRKADDKFTKLENAINTDNQNFLDEQQQQQQMIMRSQDEDLTELQYSVGTLGQIGLTLHDELETQNRLLDDLDEDVDSTTAKMTHAMKKVNRILKDTADKKPWCVIAVLSLILIVLIVVVFNV